MTNRPDLVIDADGHVSETNGTYERIDPRYRERRPIYTEVSKGNVTRLIDSRVGGPEEEQGFFHPALGGGAGVAFMWRRAGTYNPWARLPDLDADNTDVTVMYPTHELPLTVTADVGFAAARAHVYNDWLYDFCQVCPDRLKGVAIVPLQDVGMAVEELHRAVTELGMVAVQIGCTVRQDTLLSNVRLNPFWEAAEQLDVPVAIHGPALPSFLRSYFDIHRPDHVLEANHIAHAFGQMLACSNVITSGVLERFPKLRVAFLEAGAGWVPYWMHRMDEYNEVAPERWSSLSAKPSEYIKGGRVFFSCEPDDEELLYFLEHVGEHAMLFASDYLHRDALFVGEIGHDGKPYEGTVAAVLSREGIPDSAKHKMLLDNSMAFCKFDKAKLGRIGSPVTRQEPEEVRQAVMPGTISARI